ncbi:MAG: hypothetical protein ABIB61_04570 [Candidatus Shapirobacteria bacterium]
MANILFPQQCLFCGKGEKYLCSSCKKRLPRQRKQVVFLKRSSLDGLFSPFAYQKEIKYLIKTYKFEMVRDLQNCLADLLFAEVQKNKLLLSYWRKKKFIFTSLPLHFIKRKWRGFDQSFLISFILADKLGFSYKDKLLIRSEFKRPQVGLNQKERQANARHQFWASKKAKGFNLIIFDDVYTTGATLKEAAWQLKHQGAGEVWGLTFCR